VLADGRFHAREALIDRGRRAAAGFARLGIGPGDAIGLLLHNQVEWFEAWLGANILGASPVPLNWHGRPDELAYIVGDCRAKALVADAELAARFPGLAGESPLLVAGEAAMAGAIDWAGWVDRQEPHPGDPSLAAGLLVYTSGSTGSPKGIRRFPREPEAAAVYGRVAREIYGIEPGMRTVVCAPLYHSAPMYHSTAALLAGGLVLLERRFDPRRLLELVGEHCVTNLLTVPTMFVRLLSLPESERAAADVSSLRHVVHGAAPCPVDVKRRMLEWWGPIIVEYYGCTESGIVTAAGAAEWLAHPGTVGRPVAGSVVAVYDDEARRLGPGQPGDIYVHNPGSADFTYENRAPERAAVERDGLVTCGDIGYLDAGGYLYLLDRRKDMIISGGVNIYPAEIESELMAVPGVFDCAVFGIPDPEYGEVPAAAVAAQPGRPLNVRQIQDALAPRLGALKMPRVIELVAEVPRDANGKLQKRKLRDHYWEGSGRQI
jgi:long-chain acyl-CoA synthetase